MEICMKNSHTCPLGVLRYSAMESVVLFSTAEELKHVSHSIVEVMELQDDAITVRTMAPSEAHITTYTTVWHLKPTTGDGEPHTPPNKLPQVGEHHVASKWSLVTLMTTSYISSWKTLLKK